MEKGASIKATALGLKVKSSIGNAPISKYEMEALITNHVKEYVLTNTLHNDNNFAGKPPTN